MGNILYKWLTKVYICNFYILLESEIFFRNLASLATVAVRYKRQYLYSKSHYANTADMELLDPISFCLHKLFIEQQSTVYFPL